MLVLLIATAVFGQEPAELREPESAVQDTSALPAFADSVPAVELVYPQILIDMPHVRIEQDSLITLLMEEKIAGVERGEHERAGFRVQIYSSNHPQRGKSEALLLEQRVRQSLNVPVYVIYASPSWKARSQRLDSRSSGAASADATGITSASAASSSSADTTIIATSPAAAYL